MFEYNLPTIPKSESLLYIHHKYNAESTYKAMKAKKKGKQATPIQIRE